VSVVVTVAGVLAVVAVTVLAAVVVEDGVVDGVVSPVVEGAEVAAARVLEEGIDESPGVVVDALPCEK